MEDGTVTEAGCYQWASHRRRNVLKSGGARASLPVVIANFSFQANVGMISCMSLTQPMFFSIRLEMRRKLLLVLHDAEVWPFSCLVLDNFSHPAPQSNVRVPVKSSVTS